MASRLMQATFIVAVLGLSWLAMMAVHELGHVLHALVSGGSVVQLVLGPLDISRTDVAPNPHPQFVAWGGALWGVMIPIVLLAIVRLMVPKYAYLTAFFAGFCLIANGLYLTAGSVTGIGDAGDLLRNGAAMWQLIFFGVPATVAGFWLWNGLGPHFGFGVAGGKVDSRAALAVVIAFIAVIATETLLSSR